MRSVAFATISCGLRVRACASTSTRSPAVVVENLCERTAAVAWAVNTEANGPYRVTYGIAGQPLTSLRTTWLPNLKLYNLRPGSKYALEIQPGDISTSFETQMLADPAAADIVAGGKEEDLPLTEISRLEIRVGRVLECERHPEADTLYVEQIDCGEEKPRIIVSGLVKYISPDDLIGRSVVVLCNLKPRTMRGITSHGMLLCASNEDHTVVDPLAAPDGAAIGELVTFEGHRKQPAEAGNRATKAFDRVAADLRTTPEGTAMYLNTPFGTSAGPCFSPAEIVGSIS